MKKNKSKGFTIVELVIVIAVIAVLAAVLIPTFSGVISNANLSADKQAVKNMNTAIAAEAVEEEINSINKAREILLSYGFASKNLVAKTADHTIYWDSIDYKVVLVNEKTQMIVFPTEMTFDNTSNRYMNLSIVLPNAGLEDKGANKVVLDLGDFAKNSFGGSTTRGEITLDRAIQLSVDQNNLGDTETLKWHADFTLTFNKSFEADIEDGNLSDGEVGFILAGSYEEYFNGEWIPIPVLSAEAGEPIRVLQEVLSIFLGVDGNSVFLTYQDIVSIIPTFECGMKAVYDNKFGTENFNINEQTMDDLDKAFLDGLEATIELRLFEIDKDGNETGESHIIETIKHTYNVE